MRSLKFLGAVALGVALWTMWGERDFVVDAYRTDDAESADLLGFDGLALELERDELTPSIHERHRRSPGAEVAPPALAFDAGPVAVAEVDPAIEGGDASLWGAVRTADPTVVGLSADAEVPPERWPVAGAVVEIERVTTAGRSSVVVTTDETGVFELPDIRGGRYRIRAYLPRIATSGGAQILFVGADEAARVEPLISRAPTDPVVEVFGGDGTEPGGTWTVAATVASRHVDAEGRIVHRPLAGADLQLSIAPAPVAPGVFDPETGETSEPTLPGAATIASEVAVVSDASGAGRWLVSCDVAGPVLLTVGTPGGSATVQTDACRAPVAQDLGADEGAP